MEYETYCKMYIDTEITYNELYKRLLTYLSGTKQGVSTIISSWCSISVKYNSYHNQDSYLNDKSDFVYWTYYLDMEPNVDIAVIEYIDKIKELILYLNSFCKGVIPSCDFEELLNS